MKRLQSHLNRHLIGGMLIGGITSFTAAVVCGQMGLGYPGRPVAAVTLAAIAVAFYNVLAY